MSFWDHKAATSCLQLFDGDHPSTLVGHGAPLIHHRLGQLHAHQTRQLQYLHQTPEQARLSLAVQAYMGKSRQALVKRVGLGRTCLAALLLLHPLLLQLETHYLASNRLQMLRLPIMRALLLGLVA